MLVWVVKAGEPIPGEFSHSRRMRMGYIAKELALQGHDVIWFASNFDHFAKSWRPNNRQSVEDDGAKIRVITMPSIGYRQHFSVRRYLEHLLLGIYFFITAWFRERPEIILVALPTTELSFSAALFAKLRGCELIVDVRDRQPDSAGAALKPLKRFIARPLLAFQEFQANFACHSASKLIAVSEAHLEWALLRANRVRRSGDEVVYLAQEFPDLNNESDELAIVPTALFLGVLSSNFEFETLLALAQENSNKPLPVKFVICGDGPQYDRLKALSLNNIHIHIPGWSGAELSKHFLDNSAIGLAPYIQDSNFRVTPTNKIIEYRAWGLPVVTTLQYSEDVLQLLGREAFFWYESGSSSSLLSAINCALEYWRTNEPIKRRPEDFKQRFDAKFAYRNFVRRSFSADTIIPHDSTNET